MKNAEICNKTLRDLFLKKVLVALAGCALATPTLALAHGFAGQRFFPATIATDDPFVADELSLPTYSTIRVPGDKGDPSAREYDWSVDFAKRITPRLALSIGQTYTRLEPDGGGAVNGFQNLEVGGKYQLWENDEHEALFSAGADAEVGGTGREAVGADSASTITPSIFFGKGFGDLPDEVSFLKPLALTGQIGVSLPTSAASDALEYGFAVEYSFIYLQQSVKDIGLPVPLNRLIPLVEFSMETPFNRADSGNTVGTINPGVIWSGRFCQFGAEAIVPINDRTASDVGVVVQLHFYLDDLFPHTFGRPIFER